MNNHLISIIVPIHNSESKLEKCINSLLNQTYTNIEIILVDDGSTDNSYSICKEYEKLDSRIISLHQKNSGVSCARNIGVHMCNGDYIGFVDSDDYIESTMYEKVLTLMESTKSMIGVCNYSYEDDNFNCIADYNCNNMTFDSNHFPKYMIDYFSINGFIWNKLYKRELIINTKGQLEFSNNIKMLEDNLFNYEIYHKNQKFLCVYTNEKLYHYVQYNDSTCNKKYNLDKLQYFTVRNKEIDIVEQKGLDSDYLKADYVFNFTKDKFKINYLNLTKDDNYFCLEKKYNEYLKNISFVNLNRRMKIKFLICKYLPLLISLMILVRKENL